MSYDGDSTYIPLGQHGVLSDQAADKLPIGALSEAENVLCRNGLIEKAPGSARWNASALGSAIRGLFDYHPDSFHQKWIAVLQDGSVYALPDADTNTLVSAQSGSPSNLQITGTPVIVLGGNESISNDKKVFIFTGGSQIQVMTANENTRRDITSPASDWTSANYPNIGIAHRGRLYVFTEHFGYASDPTNHENFQSSNLTFAIYPGKGIKIKGAIIYKGRLFAFKFPRGIYLLEDTDTNSDNWYFREISDAFTLGGTQAVVQTIDDVWTLTTQGTVISGKASEKLGNVAFSDLLFQLGAKNSKSRYIGHKAQTRAAAVFDDDNARVMFAMHRSGQASQNLMLDIDLANLQNPKVTWHTKDQINCFAKRLEPWGAERPYYGADDGYIYQMNHEDRLVGASSYSGSWQTHYLDMSHKDPKYKGMAKTFDFLQVFYRPAGNYNLTVDAFVDGYRYETKAYSMTKGDYVHDDKFVLDTNQALDHQSYRSQFLRVNARGETIAIRGYNSGASENFEILGVKVYFKGLGLQHSSLANKLV